MKKLFALLLLLTSFSFAQQFYVVDFDTVGNYAAFKTRYLEIPSGGKIDSITFNVFASGEIDLDSIAIHVGFKGIYGDFKRSADYVAHSTGAALTIDNADGVESYNKDVVTLDDEDLDGSNFLGILIKPATSGNDKTDTNQRCLVLVAVYRQI